MPADSPVIAKPTSEQAKEGPDDEQPKARISPAAGQQHQGFSPHGPPPNFTERHGSDVLLGMGVAMFVIGCVLLVVGHTAPGALLVAMGFLAAIVATGLGRLVLLKLDIFKVVRFFLQLRSKDDDGPGQHGTS
jgi:hypothetical protein